MSTLQSQPSFPAPPEPEPDSSYFSFMLDPPPALMLASCLLLGCTVSSFVYRRMESDIIQGLIFMLAIVASVIIGICTGLNANLIALALIPWALSFAMITSAIIHCFLRSLRPPPTRFHVCDVDEKDGLLEEEEV